ncbi:diaminopimelate epimerase, partial [bacterium]
MHGIGNDFVMIDTLATPLPELDLAELSRRTNDRRRGIGGDGLILVERGASEPFRMRMFNPDGSESEMCGNGIRCFARLLRDHGHLESGIARVETGAGVLELDLLADGQVRVDMGIAELDPDRIGMAPGVGASLGGAPFQDAPIGGYRGTAVSMGNPHVVIFTDDVASVDLESVGPELERSPFFPARVNVHFAQVLSPTELRMRTWERGAGITLACGTGACAVAVAAHLTG